MLPKAVASPHKSRAREEKTNEILSTAIQY